MVRDLGFGAAEAESLRLRADLMLHLSRLIASRGLTQAAAAEVFGVTQPRISNLVRGRIDLFSIDTLVDMLNRVGDACGCDSAESEQASPAGSRIERPPLAGGGSTGDGAGGTYHHVLPGDRRPDGTGRVLASASAAPPCARRRGEATNGRHPARVGHLHGSRAVGRAASARINQKRGAHVPLALWDLIGMIVSRDNSCRYCYGATRMMLKILGYGDHQIDRIERRPPSLRPEPRGAGGTRVRAQGVARESARDGADRHELERAGYGPGAVAEIAYAAAFAGFSIASRPSSPCRRKRSRPRSTARSRGCCGP